jgi:hypothetical protein
MIGAVVCIISLALANFGVEYFTASNYAHALEISWHQAVAIFIYHCLWVKE